MAHTIAQDVLDAQDEPLPAPKDTYCTSLLAKKVRLPVPPKTCDLKARQKSTKSFRGPRRRASDAERSSSWLFHSKQLSGGKRNRRETAAG